MTHEMSAPDNYQRVLPTQIKIDSSLYRLSSEVSYFLPVRSRSNYSSEQSVVLIQDPHESNEGQFKLFKGLECFFQEHPSLILDTVFLSEGYDANKLLSLTPLIQEEPHPSDALIYETLRSHFITGYMAYEWKHQHGIPIVGSDDNVLYHMHRRFSGLLGANPNMIFQKIPLKDGTTFDIPLEFVADFSLILRNKVMAQTVLEQTKMRKNPMLFVGYGHMHTDKRFDAMFDLIQNRLNYASRFGPMMGMMQFPGIFDVPYFMFLGKDLQNLGVADYFESARTGYTFLDPIYHISSNAEEQNVYSTLFSFEEDYRWLDHPHREQELVSYFELLRSKNTNDITVVPSPERAAEYVRFLKSHGELSSAQSGIIYEWSGNGNDHEPPGNSESDKDSDRPGWFAVSKTELQETIGRITLWDEPPVIRGRLYEQVRHANLASNCPHIDDIRLEAQTVTSMKTLDITSSNYQDVNQLRLVITAYIDVLSRCENIEWNGQKYQRGVEFFDRYLEIGIPAAKATVDQLEMLAKLQEYALTKGVILAIGEIP